MTKQDKQLDKFLDNPNGTRYAIIEKLLISNNFEKVSGKGSHQIFKHPSMGALDYLTMPVHNNECKNLYKRKAARFLSEII